MAFTEDLKEKDNFSFKECRRRDLKIYQCPPFQFFLVSLLILTLVFVTASKVVLNTTNAILILFAFGFLLTFFGWLIVRSYKK